MSRFARAACVVGELEVLCHPDRPGEPDTGAVRVVAVDGDDWPELPSSVPGIQLSEELPVVWDTLYGKSYGPYWLLTAMRSVTAAFMIGLLPADNVRGVLRHVMESPEVQHSIAAAGRFNIPPLEIFMIIEGRL